MDTKTTVERRNGLPSPTWNEGVAPQAELQAGCTRREGVRSHELQTTDAEADLSPDPLRHTDLYRLVMPYKLRV
ncbi:MAG: hypothetical protein H6838_13530 [Planctomycetes bacterium]|nr:hypothetical protein [Planctomycetota bacterium]MCB9886509.1 hypothetical protein [Planctomycetota bacterium]